MLRQSIVFFKKINEAFTTGDTEFMAANSTDDVQGIIVGSKTTQGRNELIKEMKARKMEYVVALTYSYFITHGNKAAINGTMRIAGKSRRGKLYAFCHIYELNKFKNGQVKVITSYIIETTQVKY
ncbi:hypothetical protein HUU39_04165 [candidate division KSB1 bacterium]|nr:hypothetical protein [bacterium]NUM64458.1 hypothetical protein [candidate division KSB1 bacterium]